MTFHSADPLLKILDDLFYGPISQLKSLTNTASEIGEIVFVSKRLEAFFMALIPSKLENSLIARLFDQHLTVHAKPHLNSADVLPYRSRLHVSSVILDASH